MPSTTKTGALVPQSHLNKRCTIRWTTTGQDGPEIAEQDLQIARADRTDLLTPPGPDCYWLDLGGVVIAVSRPIR